MRLVKFKNGRWGIQRGLIFKEYLGINHWWREYKYVVKYCMHNTSGEARGAAERYMIKNSSIEVESTYKL